MSAYPYALAVFSAHRDNDTNDLVSAAHVNVLQNEVAALQTALGTKPGGGFASVVDRLRAVRTDNLAGETASRGTWQAREAGLYRVVVTFEPSAPRPGSGSRYALSIESREVAGRTWAVLEVAPAPTHHLLRVEPGQQVAATGVARTGSGTFTPTLFVRKVAG